MSAFTRFVFTVALVTCVLLPSWALGKNISVEHKGTVGEAVERIAKEGGLNVVVFGKLDAPAELYLHDVEGEEALQTVARLYDLRLEQQGRVYWVRADSTPAPKDSPRPDRTAERSSIATGAVRIEPGQTVDEAVAFAGPLTVEGEVRQNAVAFGGTLRIDGTVGRDAVSFGGDVILGPNAHVQGQVVTFGGSVRKEPSSRIDGDTVSLGLGNVVGGWRSGKDQASRDASADHGWKSSHTRFDLADFVARFLLLFGLGFLFQHFSPLRFRQLESELLLAPWRCSLTGLLGLLVAVPITVLLIITIIGIPFALALWAVLAAGWVAGVAAATRGLGQKLPVLSGRAPQTLLLAVGLLLFLLGCELPKLGTLLWLWMGFAATGAVLRTRFGGRSSRPPEPAFALQLPGEQAGGRP